MNNLRHLFSINNLGVLLSIIGIALGYLLYRRALPRKRLLFRSKSSHFPDLDRPPPDVEIFFRGQKIPRIAKTYIALWNGGNTSIKGEEIVISDPLRFVTSPNSAILDASLFSSTREVNGFSLRESFSLRENGTTSNEMQFEFDFLDPQDGVVVTLFHTGDSQITMQGTLRGIPLGATNLGQLVRLPLPKYRRAWAFGFLAASMFLSGYIALNYYVEGYLTLRWGLAGLRGPWGPMGLVDVIGGILLILVIILVGLALYVGPIAIVGLGIGIVRFVQNSPPTKLELPEEI